MANKWKWVAFGLGAIVGGWLWLSGWSAFLLYELRTFLYPPITPEHGAVVLHRAVPAPDIGDPVLGAGTPVLAVFVNYRCKASRQFLDEILPQLDATIVIYDYPLSLEDEQIAATLNCLYAQFGEDAWGSFLHKNPDLLEGCSGLRPWLLEVRKDKEQALKLGVVGTPTVISLTTGKAIAGLRTLDEYRAIMLGVP